MRLATGFSYPRTRANRAMSRATALSRPMMTMRTSAAPQARLNGAAVGVADRQLELLEDEGRQRLLRHLLDRAGERVEVDLLVDADEQQQRRGLARDPGHASMTPVTMPPSAVGSTTRRIVCHFGTPSAYDASRSSFGTSLSISSVDRTIDRQHEDQQRERAGEAGLLEAEGEDPEREDEQAGDDRRHAGHHVDEEADRRGRTGARRRTRPGRSRRARRAARRSTVASAAWISVPTIAW